MRILIVFLLLVLTVGWASGETSDPDAFSLYLADAEIRDVLHMLGRHFNLNIISSSDVSGKISVYFTGVDPGAALQAIVNSNGFEYREKEGNIIEVFRPVEEPEPAVREESPIPGIRLIELVHADAADVLVTLKGLVPENSGMRFQVDARRNAIVVKGVAHEIDSVFQLLRDLDHEVPQIRIEVQIVETILSDSERIGVDWFGRLVSTGARRPHTFPFDNTVTGGSFFPRGQTIGDSITFSSATGTTESSNLPDFADGLAFPFASVEDFIFGYLDATQFQAVLELIQTEAKTKLVARPEITTTNNREAVINIGNQVPVPTFSRNEETSVTTISGYEEKYVGTSLSVIPRVTEGNFVTIRIRPEISDILEFRGEGVFQVPVTATRSADTQVTMEHGKTLVIGGLVRERKVTRESKFPFLGDVPGLKYLFSYKGTDMEKSDLLIFITPHIVGPDRLKNVGKVEFEGKWLEESQLKRIGRIREMLGSEKPAERIRGLEELDRVVDSTILELLDPIRSSRRAMLDDPDPSVRVAGARALATHNASALLGTLVDAMKTKDPRLVGVLVQTAMMEPALHLRLALFEGAGSVNRRATIEALSQLARSTTGEHQERAVEGLWTLEAGSDARAALSRSLGSGDSCVQAAAIRCLGSQGSQDLIRAHYSGKDVPAHQEDLVTWALHRDRSRDAMAKRVIPTLRRVDREGGAIDLVGSPYEKEKLEEALLLLETRAPTHSHMVRCFLSEIEIVEGSTRVDEEKGRLLLNRDDFEHWPVFGLAHQLVRFSVDPFLLALGRDLPLGDRLAMGYRAQYWALHSLLDVPDNVRSDYCDFMRTAVARVAR